MSVLTIPKPDLQKISKVFLRKIGLFFLFVGALYLDSAALAEKFQYNQIVTNVFMILAFLVMYRRSTPRIKEQMRYAIVLGFIGEYLFSVVLDMYTYRLGNVPLYVPFGHAVVYGRVLSFSKASIIQKYSKEITQFFYIIISLFALGYLYFFNDVFGFIMTLGVFAMLIHRPKDRIFFLTMYLVVAVLEIGGTAYSCWVWPDTAFGIFPFLKSHNPPSGISLFYFLLDVGCFVIYIWVNHKTWQRFKRIKKK